MKKLVNNMAMGQSGGGACQQNKSIHPKKHHSHLKTHTYTHQASEGSAGSRTFHHYPALRIKLNAKRREKPRARFAGTSLKRAGERGRVQIPKSPQKNPPIARRGTKL